MKQSLNPQSQMVHDPIRDRPDKVELKALLRANDCDYAIWQFEEPWASMRSPGERSCYERPISWIERYGCILEDPKCVPYNYVLESYSGGFIYFGHTFKECLDFLPVNMRKPIQQLLLDEPSEKSC